MKKIKSQKLIIYVVLELPDKVPLMLWEKNQERNKKVKSMKKVKKWEMRKMKKMKVVVLFNKSYVCINKLLAREVHVISD